MGSCFDSVHMISSDCNRECSKAITNNISITISTSMHRDCHVVPSPFSFWANLLTWNFGDKKISFLSSFSIHCNYRVYGTIVPVQAVCIGFKNLTPRLGLFLQHNSEGAKPISLRWKLSSLNKKTNRKIMPLNVDRFCRKGKTLLSLFLCLRTNILKRNTKRKVT